MMIIMMVIMMMVSIDHHSVDRTHYHLKKGEGKDRTEMMMVIRIIMIRTRNPGLRITV